MNYLRLIVILVVLMTGGIGTANSGSNTNIPATIINRSNQLVGVWTNEKNEFSEANIMFFKSGGGVIIVSFAAGYFKWKLNESGEISLELFEKSPPPITMFYDNKSDSIILMGGDNEEIFKKSDKPLRDDPIIAALDEEKRSLIKWKKKYKSENNIHIEENIGLDRAKELHAVESNKGGGYGYGVYFEQYPDKRVVSLSNRNNNIKLFLHISEAIDTTLPRKWRKTTRGLQEIPEVTIPKRTYISPTDAKNIQSFLKANSIEFKDNYSKFDYNDGYKIGFDHSLIIPLNENNVDKVISGILMTLIKEQNKVSVKITRKRGP